MDIKELEHKFACMRPRMLEMAERLLPKEDAEDAVQDALCRMWIKRDYLLFHVNPDAAMLRVLKNLVISRLRRKSFLTNALDESIYSYFEEETEEEEESLKKVMKSLEALPSKQMLVLRMKYMDGKTTDEIESLTGMRQDAIRANLSRAIRTLRRWIAVVVVAIFGLSFSGYGLHVYRMERAFRLCYGDSYALVNGKRITDMRRLKAEIDRSTREADALMQDYASLRDGNVYEKLSDGVTDPEVLNVLKEYCQ